MCIVVSYLSGRSAESPLPMHLGGPIRLHCLFLFLPAERKCVWLSLCKIVQSVLCSLDWFSSEKCIFVCLFVCFLEIQFQKRPFEERVFFSLLNTHLVTRKNTKNSFSTCLTYILSYLLALFATYYMPFHFAKLQIHHVWFLFGVTDGVNSWTRHFGAINKYQIANSLCMVSLWCDWWC